MRVHFSGSPLGRVQREKQYADFGKPRGLWFSVQTGAGDGWLEWCRAEEFRVDTDFEYAYELRLEEDRILRLEPKDLDKFTERFGIAPRAGKIRDIDWAYVAKLYGGIEIAPYSYAHRHRPDSFWYYGWDCASGCVWDPASIWKVTRVAIEDVPQAKEDQG